MSSDPHQPPNTRDETINDRAPWCADPTNDTSVLAIIANVEATAAAEVSVEDVDEEEAYISVIDGGIRNRNGGRRKRERSEIDSPT